jgi:plastocyanin
MLLAQPRERGRSSTGSPMVKLSDGEELVLIAGRLDVDSGWQAGLGVEGEEITSPGPTITVNQGATVTITFENNHYLEDGRPFGVPHNIFIVSDKDVSFISMEPLWGAHVGGFGDPNLSEGERGSVTFTAEDVGSFFYVCANLDHVERGMWGHFIVE